MTYLNNYSARLLVRTCLCGMIIMALCSQLSLGQNHPKLILTKQGVTDIRENLGKLPVFDNTLNQITEEVDAIMAEGVQVPIPKDLAGGYTHEQHKKNFFTLQKAGFLYQITENDKYAIYVRDVLMEYARIYPDLGLHPATRSYARGKIFWQCLNDANWLVYTSQAYDCIYDWLSKKERKLLEKDLLRPFADLLSIESPQFFNRIHNHSTWGNAAVGMLGLVLDDDELIRRALYGLDLNIIDPDLKDNDGGFIKMEGQSEAGFLANLEAPFSPDGYYTEGPYYQRYAMYPFMLFAEALENAKPELKIFAYKDSVLIKSVTALLNLTDQKGAFYPINDAQKGMSYLSRELVAAVNIAYHFGGNNPSLLSIAEMQEVVSLNDSGLAVAKGIQDKKTVPFLKKSMVLRDGAQGDQGGLAIFRSGSAEDELSLLLKYAAQGLSHGHYDKLSFSLYDNGYEIIQDYGLARFVNIEQKNGGGYLKENTSWAKQTIAHNTVIRDEQSHFGGTYSVGSQHHSDGYFTHLKAPFQIASAKDQHAYPGNELHRTMVLIEDPVLPKPLVLDVFRVGEDTVAHQYDLPFYFKGQVISTNFKYDIPPQPYVLGSQNGYQHLWREASGQSTEGMAKLTWLQGGRFYTLTSLVQADDELTFTRLGANDPEFNLRRDAGLMIRKKGLNALFVSLIEPHGSYDPVGEMAVNAHSKIQSLKLLHHDTQYSVIEITWNNQLSWEVSISNMDNAPQQTHQLEVMGSTRQWRGPYQVTKKHTN